jgi:hypothetical protein
MKNGIASKVKEVVDAYMRCATIVSVSACPITRNVKTAVNPMLMATGTPRRINTIKTAKITSVVIVHLPNVNEGSSAGAAPLRFGRSENEGALPAASAWTNNLLSFFYDF